MNTHRLVAPTVLFSLIGLPFAWIACGGKTPPPEDPSSTDQSSSSAPAGSDQSAGASSGSQDITAPSSDTSASTADTSASTPAPPPTPALSDTDCGKCIDKSCAKQAAACGKNTSCKTTLDGIHSCTGTLGSCLDGATAPTDAKPKKLATAFTACADKAGKKACKAQCNP